ncbi:MAG: ATP-binding protein [Deltaproteobacteria bacterium]|nr:ATP-binding protein [Deltaproteobacteria bacterium]
MSARKSIQRSIVARRIFALFIICALIPIGSLAFLSLWQMTDRLEEESNLHLHHANKKIGVSILEGLAFLPYEMQVLAVSHRDDVKNFSPGPAESIKPHHRSHFLGITRFPPRSAGEALFGTPCPLPQLDASARKHLDSGQALVFVRKAAGGGSRMFMALAYGGTRTGNDLLVGEISRDYLQDLIEYVAPPESNIAVLDSSGASLFHYQPLPVAVTDRAVAEMRRTSTGRFEWNDGDQAYLANYRSIFLKVTYLCDDWMVVISLPRSGAFAQVRQFTQTFVMILLLTLLVVLLLSSVQIRRSLVPLEKLQEGTRHIRLGEFHRRIDVKSGDEFEELALSFNAMAERLGNQFRDLTETNLRLEREIGERKQAEEQLRQSQKMEAVGRLTGGIAHDFNNILTVINGYSRILLQELGENDPIRKKIEGINGAGERAAHLVNQLLTFSRKQVVEPKVVNPNDILSGIDMMLQRLIGGNIDMTVRLAEGLWNVRIDPGQIEQVVINLVVNARDAMPGGGKLVIETANLDIDGDSVGSHPLETPGKFVILRVCDTGCGMDENIRSRVFEPFFTTKPPGKGTGLGLSTVYGIVKQNGGCILVESEPWKGAVFTVYLPRVEARPDEIPVTEKLAVGDAGGTETVLLAEDEGLVRDLVRSVLAAKGYKVLEARDGNEALEIGSGHGGAIHLLVTDIYMPHMNGYELAKRLAKIRTGIRTIYMTGYIDDPSDDGDAPHPGAIYLKKPFRPEALARKVREVIDG